MLRRETSLVLSFRQKLESQDICFTPGLIYLFIALQGSVGQARSACKATFDLQLSRVPAFKLQLLRALPAFPGTNSLPVRIGDRTWRTQAVIPREDVASVIDDLPSKLLSIVSSSEKFWPWSLPPRPSCGKVSDRPLGQRGENWRGRGEQELGAQQSPCRHQG